MWKNVRSTRRTRMARVVSILRIECLYRFPHPRVSEPSPHHTLSHTQSGWKFLRLCKMNKNRKKCEQMCVTLGACRGVGCIHHRASWTTSHPAALHSLPPRPPRWVFSQTSHTPVPGPFLVEIDRG